MRILEKLYKAAKDKKHEQGFVLTEHLGGILFYVIMIGMAAGVIIMLFATSKISAAQQSLSAMAMSIQGVYSGQSDYSGLSNEIAIKAGVVPPKFLKGGTIKSPWGTEITVGASEDNGTFVISFAGIKDEDCVKLATFQMDYWVDVSVNSSTIPVTSAVSAATSSCTGNNNNVSFTAR